MRIVRRFLFIGVLLASAPALASEFGDLNCDGAINVVDVVVSINLALELPLSNTVDPNGNAVPDDCEPYVAQVICGPNTVLNALGNGCDLVPGILDEAAANGFADGVASVLPASFCGTGTVFDGTGCIAPPATCPDPSEILCDYGIVESCSEACTLGVQSACVTACNNGDAEACLAACENGEPGACVTACSNGSQGACLTACGNGHFNSCVVACYAGDMDSCITACNGGDTTACSIACGYGDIPACITVCNLGDTQACCDSGDVWACVELCNAGTGEGCVSACDLGNNETCQMACNQGYSETCIAACDAYGVLTDCQTACSLGDDNACADVSCLNLGCPSMNAIGNTLCDSLCDNAECSYDGGDCE